MPTIDYKSEYDKLVKDSPNSVELIRLLQGWACELIAAGKLEDAQAKTNEYCYRAFKGALTKYSGYQFFNFRGCSDHAFSEITRDKLSVSHPETFNDPLDTILFTYLRLNIEKETDPVKQMRLCMLLKAAHHLRMKCFVRTTPLEFPDGTMGEKEQDIRQVNPLMWAHYADYHRGYCALYELNDSFVTDHGQEIGFTRMGIMDYQKVISINKNLKIGDALLWKNDIWSYEQEVRVIDFDLHNTVAYKELDAPKLKAIYLGVKCSDGNRQLIETALREKQVKLYQMRISKDDVCALIPERIG